MTMPWVAHVVVGGGEFVAPWPCHVWRMLWWVVGSLLHHGHAVDGAGRGGD